MEKGNKMFIFLAERKEVRKDKERKREETREEKQMKKPRKSKGRWKTIEK